MKRRSPMDLLMAAILAALGVSSISIGTIRVDIRRDVTPADLRNGWDAAFVDPDAPADEFAAMGAAGSGTGAVVKLWEYAQAVNGGAHFPTFRQQIGDCVAQGAANAVNYLQAVQIARDSSDQEWRSASRLWIYGVSRTAPDLGNRRLGRSDGSVGSWAADTCKKYGVLSADEPGVPLYSKEAAREWGYTGPPPALFDVADDFRIRTIAKVASYEDVCDALANGYPVTIASNVGFEMQPLIRNGRHWGKRSGQWAHQMCLIAIDDISVSPFDGRAGAAYCLNSWGEAAHGEPADDAPPGGFWIDRSTIEAIVRQEDSWAFSNFDGFPVRDLNFNIFAAHGPALDIAKFEPDAPDTAPLSEALLGVEGPLAQGLGGVATMGSSLALAAAARRRRRDPSAPTA